MMRSREVTRGLVALVAMAGLLVGVPWALVVFVGWPLPASVPSMSTMGDALGTVGVSEEFLVKALAVVVWVAWIQLAVSIGAEVFAMIRRRAPRRVPGTGAVGGFARALVASVAVLVGSIGVARPAPLPSLAAAVAAPLWSSPAAARPAVSTAGMVTMPPIAPLVTQHEATWVVGPRDTLWGIAEATLGSGERWQELHRMNVGREVAPGTIFDEATQDLRSGWKLVVSVPAERTVRVEAGDTLSRLAERHYGAGASWLPIWEANRGRHFGSRTFDDPNLILVGWELRLPGAPAAAAGPGRSVALGEHDVSGEVDVPLDPSPVPAPAESVDPSAPPVAPTTSVGPEAGAADPSSDDLAGGQTLSAPAVSARNAPVGSARPALPTWVQPMGLSGAALLATGLSGLVASRRRRRLRSVGRRETLPPLDASLARVEASIRSSSEPLALARLDVALRALAAGSVGTDARPLVVLHHADGHVEVELAGTTTAGAPSPWLEIGPTRWSLPDSVDLSELVAHTGTASSPCPALVYLGTTDDAVAVHLDLEAAGLVALDGDATTVESLARAMLATLSVSPLADVLGVVCSGLEVPGLDARIETADDPDAALEAVAAMSAGLRRSLDDGGPATTFGRRAQGLEVWEPTVGVIVGHRIETSLRRHAEELVGPGGRGVALVVDAAIPEARCRLGLDVTTGRWTLEPLGLVVRPHGLAADELAAVAALLTALDAEPEADAMEPAPGEPFVEPSWSLLVRLLGPIDVVDHDQRPVTFERSKALELVAWLAVHPDNPTRVAARTALWETDVRGATFANVVSDARRSLARRVTPPDGEEWLTRTHGERLPLHPQVRTDAEVLRARLVHARGSDDDDAVRVLRPGLELVRDQPFSGAAFTWPDAEAIPSDLVVLGTSAAAELAVRCLQLGDLDGAFWATTQGLKVLPGHEELVCLRMEAHGRRGDLRGVRAEYEAYERVVLADAWADGALSPKVVLTRNRLLAEASAASAVAGGRSSGVAGTASELVDAQL